VTPAPRKYACVLRWKAGERNALASIAAQRAALLVPIIEPTPSAFRRAGERRDAFRNVLRKTAQQIGLVWAKRPCFVDAHLIQGIASSLSLDPLLHLMSETQSYGLRVAPVLRLRHHSESVRAVVAVTPDSQLIGLRVSGSEIGSEVGAARLSQALAQWGLGPERIHLFIDLGVVKSDVPQLQGLLGTPWLRRWGALTLLAGSFPRDLTGLRPDIHYVPRIEWRMYKHLLRRWPSDVPAPTFGDYGTQHAEFREPKVPCFPSMSVRYAMEDDWLVLRGYSNLNREAGGSHQFYAHARYLVDHPEFAGAGFCVGDRYIVERLSPGATTGNLTTWLAASMDHHMSLTAANVARLSLDPSRVLAEQIPDSVRAVNAQGPRTSIPRPTSPSP